MAIIDEVRRDFPVSLICRELGMARSRYYAWRSAPPRIAPAMLLDQVKQIHANLCAAHGMRVSCFGLRTDFQGNPFEGATALLALADSLHEISTLCRCGTKATMNQRIDSSGQPVRQGAVLEIGGDSRYRPVCPRCFY